MKNGKKATREQRKLMEQWGFDAHDWFVTKDTSTEMHIVHQYSDKTTRIIPKGRFNQWIEMRKEMLRGAKNDESMDKTGTYCQ